MSASRHGTVEMARDAAYRRARRMPDGVAWYSDHALQKWRVQAWMVGRRWVYSEVADFHVLPVVDRFCSWVEP